MYCPRCETPMREEKRLFHKQRKWICPRCGRVRMQKIRSRKSRTAKALKSGQINIPR